MGCINPRSVLSMYSYDSSFLLSVGGSALKLLYRSKEDFKDGKPLKNSVRYTNNNFMKYTGGLYLLATNYHLTFYMPCVIIEHM